jgi:hypothetical protein
MQNVLYLMGHGLGGFGAGAEEVGIIPISDACTGQNGAKKGCKRQP